MKTLEKILLLIIVGMILTGLFLPLMGGWSFVPAFIAGIIWGGVVAVNVHGGGAGQFFMHLGAIMIGWLIQWLLSLIPVYDSAKEVIEIALRC